ncbi:TonB family protein [Pyxidicoccus sp. 3LG]
MFKSVIERQRAGRLGSGVWLSIGVHAALFAAVLFLSSAPREQGRREPPVIDFPDNWPQSMGGGTPAPAPPKQATQRPSRPRQERAPRQARSLPAEPTQPREPTPVDTSTTDEVADTDTAVTTNSTASIGLPIGVDPGIVGCLPGPGLGMPTGEDVEPFGQGMTPPVMMGGQPIEYTPQALAARVEGSLVAKCVITEQGRVRDCRIIKGLAHMDESVLEALHSRRYRPVTFQGQPVSVSYNFTVRLSLPR